MVLVLVAVGALVWSGVTLIIDTLLRRLRRPSLIERLRAFRPTVADEADVWLHRQ